MALIACHPTQDQIEVVGEEGAHENEGHCEEYNQGNLQCTQRSLTSTGTDEACTLQERYAIPCSYIAEVLLLATWGCRLR